MPDGHFSTALGGGRVRGVVVLLLAGGFGRRFGGDKLAARLPDGRAVGEASLALARTAWPDVVCVVRPGSGMAAIARQCGVPMVECPEAADGMGHTLAAGVRASIGAAGWVVALADMPFLSAATVRTVAEAVSAGSDLVAPVHGGERGHPVGFGARFGPELAGLHGDEGARTVVAAHRNILRLMPVDDPGILRDIDQPSDLERGPPSG
jgi:molybdenum cofactor cytidylyltransferase